MQESYQDLIQKPTFATPLQRFRPETRPEAPQELPAGAAPQAGSKVHHAPHLDDDSGGNQKWWTHQRMMRLITN